MKQIKLIRVECRGCDRVMPFSHPERLGATNPPKAKARIVRLDLCPRCKPSTQKKGRTS